jgi:biopolymer transport protein ExbD
MAISMGSSGKREVSDINMTPMIDVLLVLLVIFMIAQPLLQKSIDVQVPEDEQDAPPSQVPHIVLEIAADGSMTINTQPVTAAQLEQRLRWIYADREDRVLFIKPDDSVEYQTVIQAMDAARGAGVSVLGAML